MPSYSCDPCCVSGLLFPVRVTPVTPVPTSHHQPPPPPTNILYSITEDNFSVSLSTSSSMLLILPLHCFFVLIMTFSIEQRHNHQLMCVRELQPLHFIMDFIMDQFQVEVCVMIDQGQSRHYVQLFIRQHPSYG